jgi:dihydropteroate synthase
MMPPDSAAVVPSWAGFTLDRPLVMGIVNVTPDSFSDGGAHATAAAAIAHGRRLRAEGADILDIGGESTRPGAEPVPPAVEQSRILPVIAALAADGAVISVDTRHAVTMRAALAAGARIINDVTALTGDPDSLSTVASARCPVVLMHMQGQPQTMQQNPSYQDVVTEVSDWLRERVQTCIAAGIAADRIAIDPGIGFGKTVEHNLALLRATDRLAALGQPLLIGVSRKRFIASLSRGEPPDQRLPGSLAAALAAVQGGAAILRVHDVAATVQALAVWGHVNLPGSKPGTV